MYVMGVDPSCPTTEQEHALGALGANPTDDGTKVYVYLQAAGAVPANRVVQIEPTWQADLVAQDDDVVGSMLAATEYAFADNEYGWFQIYGLAEIRAEAAVAANARVGPHATADGQIDDATPNAFGMIAVDAITADNVGTVMLTYPVVSA